MNSHQMFWWKRHQKHDKRDFYAKLVKGEKCVWRQHKIIRSGSETIDNKDEWNGE